MHITTIVLAAALLKMCDTPKIQEEDSLLDGQDLLHKWIFDNEVFYRFFAQTSYI